jgi:insertion element IS1 protein InsB
MRCPNCQSENKQSKCGFNPSGSQKYKCGECKRVYTPKPNPNGYPEETRLLAIRMYVEGSSYGSIARILQINPQSVANWVSQYTAKLPAAPMPNKVKKAELDELYTFVGKKKTKFMSSR